MKKTLLILVWWTLPGPAQDPMPLKDAVRHALAANKSMAVSTSDRSAAERRVVEARSGNLPKVNYSESWTRSDNPVFVFSSLLTQHQFGEQNFQVSPLNRPDFLNNFQSQLTADQSLRRDLLRYGNHAKVDERAMVQFAAARPLERCIWTEDKRVL
jgi:outer membrane protein TolC